jgi:predicted P-loop ATPase/GTPase
LEAESKRSGGFTYSVSGEDAHGLITVRRIASGMNTHERKRKHGETCSELGLLIDSSALTSKLRIFSSVISSIESISSIEVLLTNPELQATFPNL